MMEPAPKPDMPKHLRAAGRNFWLAVLADFALADDQLPLLQAACESLDIAAAARRKLRRAGMVFNDKHGQPRAHPLVAIHRASLAEFRQHRRELGLDVNESDRPRGPASKNFENWN